MEDKKDTALLLAWALAAGVAAGTAAAVTATTFPYAAHAVLMALGSSRREQREHRHRHKSEKVKRVVGKPKEGRPYRDAVRRSITKWEDISVSFDDFPYFLDEYTKHALLDSVFVYLKRPDYVKFTADLASVSSRILLTGPLGSEIYQQSLVQALAKHLQVNLLVFDSAALLLEARKSSNQQKNRLIDASFVAQQDHRNGSHHTIEEDNLGLGEEGTMNGEIPSLGTRSQETPNILDSVAYISASKKIARNVSDLKAFTRLYAGNRMEVAKDLATMTATTLPTMTVDYSKRKFKKGDRVKYIGPSLNSSPPGLAVVTHGAFNGGPSSGSKGRVLLVLDDNLNKVGVRFDKPVYGGNNLLDLCEDGHGYFCNVMELRLEHASGEDVDKLIFDSFLEVVVSEASKHPMIVLIKNLEKSIAGNFERYMKLERLEKTDAKVVIIGCHTSDQQKEKGGAHSLFTSKAGSSLSSLRDLSLLDHISSRIEDYRGDSSKTAKLLSKIFPSKVAIQTPKEQGLEMQWNRQLEEDMQKLKVHANILQLQMVMGSSNVDCDTLQSIDFEDLVLTEDMAEKVVGWAISHHLQRHDEPSTENGRLVIGVDSIQHSLSELQSTQRTLLTDQKKTLKDVVVDNEFEKMLLSEVIPPNELGVSFLHIGALENVKETLRELVMLPLQRPELFVKGQLTKPCRGLLLFGPPGTGKTMLAKAVATEAKANFINVSMSTVASKWFGEAEKYVKAVFTLASKISPSVIFIDEVDSMLGRRGKDSEHSAMRKLKNEFMSSWDGLRTREKERVLVLAATNRPFDLDEAVIRRFPRRLMVDLPNAENRAKILKVILADEDLPDDFSIDELAAATDGYSGSDLKNLCTTAAYMRIRELLDHEKKEEEKARSEGVEAQTQHGVTPYIRPITMADMRKAMDKVRSSVASEAGSMLELHRWNEQYGEGGTKRKTTLSYYM